MDKKCCDCYNFKTKEFTEEAFQNSQFSESNTIKEKFSKGNIKVKVWWCKLGELKKTLITNELVAQRVTNMGCLQRSE